MPETNDHTQEDEKELLSKIAAGDSLAFGELFDRYYNKVLSQTLAYKKSLVEAEDLTQEIFLKVWNAREKLGAVKSFKNYLFILSRNEMVEALRKKAVELSLKETLPELKEDILLPDQQLEYREAYQLILQGMEQLPDQQKRVFRMSRLEGKTNGEIAEAMGIAKTTVRWHIVLALNFLKTYVGSHGVSVVLAMLFSPLLKK